jgi:hypothetical protein
MSGFLSPSIVPLTGGRSELEARLLALFGGDAVRANDFLAALEGWGATPEQILALAALAVQAGAPAQALNALASGASLLAVALSFNPVLDAPLYTLFAGSQTMNPDDATFVVLATDF